MIKSTARLGFALFTLIAIGCDGATSPDNRLAADVATQTNATVRRVNIEGGCWVLDVGGSGPALATIGFPSARLYHPINLPEQFRVDGLRVFVSFTRLRDVMSVCMIGPIVKIETIRPANAEPRLTADPLE